MKIFLLFSIITCLLINPASAQTIKDTIYLDENWSVCEQPVAEYFRVATLKYDKELVYIGDVEDYYLNGTKEMKGFYDDNGMRNGHFIFYSKNGKKTKEGFFKKDEMVGLWSYYDEKENISVQFNCSSSIEFTPLLIISISGDTILKGGNGFFTFNTRKDIPQVFPEIINYTVEGRIIDGKKEGEFKYWINSKEDKPQPFCKDVYKMGKLTKTSNTAAFKNNSNSCHLLNLMLNHKLLKTDFFNHNNLVFGSGSAGDEKLIKFLIKGEIPEIVSGARTYNENAKDIYNIIGTTLRPYLTPATYTDLQYPYPPKATAECEILFYTAPANTVIPIEIKSDLKLTIDSTGYISNSVFKGNLANAEINKLNYYFSRLSNLAPHYENGRKTNADLNLKLVTLLYIPGTNNSENKLSCTYIVINTDSISSVKERNRDKPASFIGGINTWKRYLKMSLNALVPLEENAPAGTYTVKVQFMVDEDGNVKDVRAIDVPKLCLKCGAEAERVIREGPKWEPEEQDGRKIKSQVTQSISFVVANMN